MCDMPSLVVGLANIVNTDIDWNSPYSFFRGEYHVKDADSDSQRTITGSVGTLLGVW